MKMTTIHHEIPDFALVVNPQPPIETFFRLHQALVKAMDENVSAAIVDGKIVVTLEGDEVIEYESPERAVVALIQTVLVDQRSPGGSCGYVFNFVSALDAIKAGKSVNIPEITYPTTPVFSAGLIMFSFEGFAFNVLVCQADQRARIVTSKSVATRLIEAMLRRAYIQTKRPSANEMMGLLKLPDIGAVLDDGTHDGDPLTRLSNLFTHYELAELSRRMDYWLNSINSTCFLAQISNQSTAETAPSGVSLH